MKWLGYLLLGAGAYVMARQAGWLGPQPTGGPTDTSAGGSNPQTTLDQALRSAGLQVGQIGSTFVTTNPLADAIGALTSAINSGGAGRIDLKTADGSLFYQPPNESFPTTRPAQGYSPNIP